MLLLHPASQCQRCEGDRPPINATSASCAVGSTGLCFTFVEGGAGSRGGLGLDVQSWAGRMGRRSKPPPQFGHTFDRTALTQSRQNVHSYVQIIASVALGGSGRLQFSQVGRSSSMFAVCQEAVPHGSTRREYAGSPRPCAPSNERTWLAQNWLAQN